MSEYRYILEPYKGMSSRYHCPKCKKNKKFARYIDTETGKQLSEDVGKCERIDSCGYHYTPKEYFQDNNISFDTPQPKTYKPNIVTPQPKPASFIPANLFKASLKEYENNHFVKFLIHLFGFDITNELISRYFIATSKHWNGATVFWQIDTQGKVRTGKIMLYNPETGKRVKNLNPPVYWVHKALKQQEFELKQCLFGQHLLIDKTKPIAIVESEKTAVIASVYLPQFIWLAVGSLSNLTKEKCLILKGRTVVLFPDINGFDKWSSKAMEFSKIAYFIVSDLLERKANNTERAQGLDIADYLIRFNYRDFAPPEIKLLIDDLPNFETSNSILECNKPTVQPPGNWSKEISELESYFSKLTIPEKPIKLNYYTTVQDMPLFIESNLSIIKAHNGNTGYISYLNQLIELKNKLSKPDSSELLQ